MTSLHPFKCLWLAVALAFGNLSAGAAGLTVFAAASLSDALTRIGALYTQSTGEQVRFNFGASGLLARQIQEGAPVDVFLSADELRMNELQRAGLLLVGTRHSLLANTLVVVVPADGGAHLRAVADLASGAVHRIAIGDPETVPAGTYAREYLRKVKLWGRLQGRLIPLNNVRAALAAVASGNADAGVVYRTDAMISKRVRIAVAIPLDQGPRITYPVAVIRTTRQAAAARAFVAYLSKPAAQAVFARYGFLPAP